MKIIEALMECANGKNFKNCKMKYKEMEFERFNEYEIYDDLYDEEITLNDEIEIIEEERENLVLTGKYNGKEIYEFEMPTNIFYVTTTNNGKMYIQLAGELKNK